MFRQGDLPVEMVPLPDETETNVYIRSSNDEISYLKRDTEQLHILTLFLFGDWIGAKMEQLSGQLRAYTDTQSVIFDSSSAIAVKE